MTRRVNLGAGLVVTHRKSGLSRMATDLWKAHTPECRYAADATGTLADLVARFGAHRILTKCDVGSVAACGLCKPTLLTQSAPDA